jgi:hypothetical protein
MVFDPTTIAQGMPLPLHIPRVRCPSLQTFQQIILPASRPVVIEGAMDHWPALAHWSPAYFAKHFGSRKVPVYKTKQGHTVFNNQQGLQSDEQSLSEFIDQITSKSSNEVQTRIRCPLLTQLPEAQNDFTCPPYCTDGKNLQINLWFSGAPTITRLHFDLPHNLLAQVYGKKRFLLFDPAQSHALYRCSLRSATPQFSEVDLMQTDLTKFPRLIAAQPFQADLSPGDLLFIPSRWWHHADSAEITLSLSFWWAPWTVYPLVWAANWFKRIRGLTR